jgi:hypothetical protein
MARATKVPQTRTMNGREHRLAAPLEARRAGVALPVNRDPGP